MTDQEVKFSNFYESTLNGVLASGADSATITAAPTSNGTSNIAAPYYLVVDPDNASQREVILVTGASGTSLSAITRDVEGRYTSDPTHADGTVVRMAVVKEMFEDIHDRVDVNDAGFVLEDGDGTEQAIVPGKEVKFVEAANGTIDINWTDVSDGSDADPYDLTFSVNINGATDGTGITVDGANDLILLYDNDAAAIKKVKTSQIATPADIHGLLLIGC
tara:strand:- start:4275 stop:4931 length:657 start_codon:yes stop_codon:yes gene_type:complete